MADKKPSKKRVGIKIDVKQLKKDNKLKAERAKLIIPRLENTINEEPNWATGDLNGYPTTNYPPRGSDMEGKYQQNELLYPILMDIAQYGLNAVFETYKNPPGEMKTTEKPKTVVIVGAGIAGLSAAYELKKAGHQVQLVEMQDRAGGRIKTYGEKDGFAKYQHADAGAMRLPNRVTDIKAHYLTDYYITHFGLDSELKAFNNADDNAFVKYYEMEPIRRKEWDEQELEKFNETWPGWNERIYDSETGENKYGITNINAYYDETMETIKLQLTDKLDQVTTNDEAAAIWDQWVLNWSKFSLVGLWRSDVITIRRTLDPDYLNEIDLNEEKLHNLLPWPEAAITAYSIFNYTEQLDQCLVQYLRDELAQWWSSNMHRIAGGMEKLTQAFVKNADLEQHVIYNFTVNEIEYGLNWVGVNGYNTTSGQPFYIEGNAVIITVPLHGIRQIQFKPLVIKESFPKNFYKAVEDIWYGPSTKIMIQSKTKFWADKSLTDDVIDGGFTKTNLPFGQVHYPSIDEGISDEDRAELVKKPGILLCYMWKAEALLFGALSPQVAVREAVRQIAQIHPEIDKQFQAGAVHAWYNDPAAQGAYALLKPHQFSSVQYLLRNPYENIFFAGEGISFAAGWIQGALESALRAAYQFYARNELGHYDPVL